MKQDKVDRRVQKAEQRAAKAAQQVQIAAQKAEKAAQKQAERIEKKAAKLTQIAEKKAAKESQRAAKAAKKVELASRKAEEKRAKIAAKASARMESDEAAEGEEGAEGAAKKKSNKKLLLLLLPVLAVVVGVGVFFFLRRGGSEEEAPPEPIAAPAQYALGGEWVIPALPVQDGVVVYGEEIVPEPAAEAGDKKDEEGEAGENGEGAEEAEEPVDLGVEFTPMQYTYQELLNARSLVAAYTTLMTSEDAGFSTVDDTMTKTDPPAFGGETPPTSGSVLLARNAPETEGVEARLVQTLTLEWSEGNCTVAVELSEGHVREPAPPEGSSGSNVTKVVESLQDLPPSVLGLEGDSMDDYRIYTQDGIAKVNGNPCLRMSVYKITDGGGNEVAGHYFLSTDGLHVYKLDVATNNVVELDIQDALK